MEVPFVHLHLHTEYSLLDGCCRIEETMERAASLNMPALAITDHGAMYGVIDFYLKAKERGIKPIIGCELYLAYRTRHDKSPRLDANQYHLVVLAKNEEGYKNLLKLVTLSNLEGFYYKPRVDKELLSQYHKGLIALSSCLAGEISAHLLAGEPEKAKRAAGELQEIFGKKNFYLELHDHHLEDQRKVNPQLIQLSKDLNIPLVVTNDVHYLHKGDAQTHDVLLCIQTGSTIDDERRLRFGSSEFYFKTPEEMRELFKDHPEALKETVEIAERCNLTLEFDKVLLPHYEVPEGHTLDSYLRLLCEENIPKRYRRLTEPVKARLDFELEVIRQKQVAAYFLIAWDIIQYAKSKGILVGPGRGSAVGSLVAYLLGITNVDPLAYGLLFERFLNPERLGLPDFDLDFEDSRRDEVIQYVYQRYGSEKVAQIITFGTMGARAAIRDAGRALKIALPKVDRIAKLVPGGQSIAEALESVFELKALYQSDEETKSLIDTAKSIEGLARHVSTHAAGVVISEEPLIHYVPLERSKEGLGMTTQYHKDAVEKIGLLKIDLLGLRNLSIIKEAINLIKKTRGVTIDLDKMPLDDPKVYEMLSAGESASVFQLESSGMRRLLKEIKPKAFGELISIVALYRPGPISLLDTFIKAKNGELTVDYMHPKLKPILSETYGVMIYQEQVMRIASALAGFSMTEADTLRSAMSKKRMDIMERQRSKFIDGAIENGVAPDLAAKIFDQIAHFAGYGFNKSHAASYALLAYQTAYLKAHFPVEYMAAVLTSHKEDSDKVASYVEECRRMKIKVLPPDINNSLANFTVLDGAISYGLSAIKNLGRGAIEAILKARREGGKFTSLLDFCQRIDLGVVNRSALESLIKSGAFDNLGANRAQMLQGLESVIQRAQRAQKDKRAGQVSLFDLSATREPQEEAKFALPDIPEMSKQELLAQEKETLGLYLSDHPLLRIKNKLRSATTATIGQLSDYADREEIVLGGLITHCKRIITKTKKEMMIFTLEDLEGSVEVTAFPAVYKKYGNYIVKDAIVLVRGRVEVRDVETEKEKRAKFIGEEIIPLQAYETRAELLPRVAPSKPARRKPEEEKLAQELHIKVEGSVLSDSVLEELKTILNKYPGENVVVLHLRTDSGVTKIALGEEFRVRVTEGLKEELENLLGEGTISK